jgi:hypothetical protein
MKITIAEEDEIIGEGEVVQTGNIYTIYKSTNTPHDLIKIMPYKHKKIPNTKAITKVNELIAILQEQHRVYNINVRTGGPRVDTATQNILFLRNYLPEDQMNRIERKVYGLHKEKKYKARVDLFIQRIRSTYFNLYTQTHPNHYLWSVDNWTDYKGKMMKRFFQEFVVTNLPPLKYHFDKIVKTSSQYDHKEQVPLQDIDFVDKKVLWGILKALPNTTTTVPSSGVSLVGGVGKTIIRYWKWDNDAEYDRLGLSGKDKSAIAIQHHQLKTPKSVYWLPVGIEEKTKKLRIIPYDGKLKRFDVSDEDAKNIVAIAPFWADNSSNLQHQLFGKGKEDMIVSVFSKSYLYYLLEMMDVALNESMKELFIKRGLSDFFDLKKT